MRQLALVWLLVLSGCRLRYDPLVDAGSGSSLDAFAPDVPDGRADAGGDAVSIDAATDPDAAVCVPTGPEDGGARCQDGQDNDCDGFADLADPECPRVLTRSVGGASGALPWSRSPMTWRASRYRSRRPSASATSSS